MNPQSPYNQGDQSPYQPQPSMQPPVQPQQQFPQQVYQQGAQPMGQPQPQQGFGMMPPVAPVKSPRSNGGGHSKLWTILTFVFIFTTIAAAGAGIYALMNYYDQRDNVDSKVTAAVAEAVKKEQDDAAAHLLEVENTPNRQFNGPSEYGNLTFNYSKLWSVYVDKDANKGGAFSAYLNPVSVPPVSATERYALRVSIEEKDYDQVVNSYQNLVSKGDLAASTFKIDETTSGTRLDGNFTKDIRGSAVIFKIRDKTVTLRSDAETFKEYFDALILTIKFDK